jgi:hypothetical protein
MSFQESLDYGRAGESQIAQWLIKRGSSVLPVYEKIFDTGKGPQLYTASGRLIAPDLVALKDQRLTWIEAKHKTAFSWHRKTQRWVTGIDIRHYEDYIRVREVVGCMVWLLFLQEGGHAKDSPDTSPSGLFGAEIIELMQNENHRHKNYGPTGMVYWARSEDGGPLRLIASLGAVKSIDAGRSE